MWRKMDSTVSTQEEAQIPSLKSKRSGWITFPFTIGTVVGLSLAGSGVMGNLTVYLMQEFNVKSIKATQISNVAFGSFCLFPIFGAIIADSFFGSFIVALVSSCVSFLGTAILALTARLRSLRPQPCSDGVCEPPSELQYGVLYLGIALAAIGYGGARFTTPTFGAFQFDKAELQAFYVNAFSFTLYIGAVLGFTVIIYVEDSVSWGLGFVLCGVVNLCALAIFLSGYPIYRPDIPQGPFADMARVLVATARKWKSQLSSRIEDYYGAHDVPASSGQRLRFFNRAALITEGDLVAADGSIAKPWRLCTLQQVEDLKSVIRILPLWCSSIFLSTPIAIQSSLTILQALTMDRHVGSHFKIPAASTTVVVLAAAAIFLIPINLVLCPAWQKLTGKAPRPLQRIGVGHVFNILGMVVSALVESKRLKIAHTHQLNPTDGTVPMSVLWLFPQLTLVGIGEAFHFPGQVSFYYQQFPESLKSTSTAMISVTIGVAFFVSTAIIDLARRVTEWMPDDINHGRIDNVYWMVVISGIINFAYYLLCSSLYKYRNV